MSSVYVSNNNVNVSSVTNVSSNVNNRTFVSSILTNPFNLLNPRNMKQRKKSRCGRELFGWKCKYCSG